MSNESKIDQFKQTFVEEAREILIELEAALLELNENPSDKELVGRAFRSLHTIKGSGAMFGFEALAAFVHNLENAFDEVRNGRLLVTPELINLSLSALDQIKAMLDLSGNEDEGNKTAREEILGKLRELTGAGGERGSPAAVKKTQIQAAVSTAVATAATEPVATPAPEAPSTASAATPRRE